ncbi:MAG TPA: DUF4232 domain-containing protein [Streptosporangiaceae bacterium]|nr:DUF4232 domain-containing protein [Streptosporangiaceae bacterium]
MRTNLPISQARRVFVGFLIASSAVVVSACSSGTPAPSGTATLTPSATQGASNSPTATAPAPTNSASPAVVASCRTTGLHVSTGYNSGAAGTLYYNIDFTNISGNTCFLLGYPGVSLVSAGSNAGSQIGADAKRDAVTPVRRITLAAGRTAHAELGISAAGNYPSATCQPVTAHWLKVFPPGQFAAAYVKFMTQTCASTTVPLMRITAVSAGK